MSEILIHTKKGIIRGEGKNGYSVFKGIPFARPPIGKLRWKAPVPVEPWGGVLDATEFAPICPQGVPAPPNPYFKEFYSDKNYQRKMSEDCLYLNIWAPENAEGKKLPVAFYIHGGGFGGGYSSEIEFDGEAFCKEDVILVTIAYRVGVFGFLALPQLDAENENHISGNYGMLDQIEALNWVYENIESFGGNPENITVFGQSAGCMSTQILISSQLTEGKIAKAIFMSGLTCDDEFLFTPTLKEEEECCKEMLEELCDLSVAELRELNEEILLKKHEAFNMKMMKKAFEEGSAGGLLIVPNVDGHLLKKNVREIFVANEFHKIPYMVGCVLDDLGTTDDDRKNNVPGLLLEQAKKWALKQEEATGIPSYVYSFDYILPGDEKPTWHSLELWYVMGTYGRSWRPMTEADAALSREAVKCWTNFMKTGNPESAETEEWKPYTNNNRFVRHFV